MTRLLIFSAVLLVCAGAMAGTCPPHLNLESCLQSATDNYKSCRELWGEALHDPDGLTNRHHAFDMLNNHCPEAYEADNAKCHQSCPKIPVQTRILGLL